ncbi:hypothetical protein QBC39DRAFT_145771 [Podospora conica]|nr:hypothetical protein QBC39DRAFT_145771 [Schizothecium conicum]
MLSRPSFSIRRLIPQRKPDSPEGKTGLHLSADQEKEPRSRTWPVGNRKGPIPTIDLRRSEDSHRIIVLPPLPDTPNSWTGSYHDFCNDTSFTSPRCSPTPPSSSTNFSPQRSPNHTPQRSPQRSPPKSPLLTPRQFDGSPRSRKSSLASAAPSQFQLSTSSSSSLPPQQLEDGWPLPSLVSPRDLLGSTDDGVQTQWLSDDEGSSQRSREGNSGRTAHGADDTFHRNESRSGVNLLSPLRFVPSSDSSMRSAAAKRASMVRRTSQRISQSSAKSGRSATKAPLKAPFSAAPKRLSSIARTKKQRQKKTRRRPRVGVPGPKWTFTEGAKDLFAIRIFNRVEADEMLPESVLMEIRMSRATQARLAKKAGGIDTDSDASPIEFDKLPFNEASSPTIPLVQHHLPPKTDEDDTTPRPSPTLRPRPDDRPAPPHPSSIPVIESSEDRETMKFKAFFRGQGHHREAPAPTHPPPLPPKNPHRRLPTGRSPPLPRQSPHLFRPSPPLFTISEDPKLYPAPLAPQPRKPPPQARSTVRTAQPSAVTAQPINEVTGLGIATPPLRTTEATPRRSDETVRPDDEATPAEKEAADHYNELSERYIILPSTPRFPPVDLGGSCHGPILIARAGIFKTKLAKAGAAADETIIDKADLSEYQAAILGGSGDFLDEVVDYTRPSEAEERELNDIIEWFDGWGFQGPGALVTAGDVAVARSLQAGVPAGFVRFDPARRVSAPVQYRTPPEVTLGGEGGQWGPPPPPPPYYSSMAPPPRPTSEREMQEVGVTGFKDYYLQHQRRPGFAQQQQQGGSRLQISPAAPVAGGGGGGSNLWRASAISLPQSPMLDIVVRQDAGGNEYVAPPMGFNLSADLPDYLDWEAKMVAGGA